MTDVRGPDATMPKRATRRVRISPVISGKVLTSGPYWVADTAIVVAVIIISQLMDMQGRTR